MNRRSLFMFLRLIHILVDRILTPVFGMRFRQQYIRLSYKIKTYLFPKYGSYVPTASQISSPMQNNVWMPPPIPEWVLSEMKNLAREIDPALYPSDAFIASCQYYSFPVIPKPGYIYEQFIQNCTSEFYTHCFAIPWLKRGGADLVALKHIEFANNQPGSKVLVLLTEPGDSPWLTRIPSDVDVLDLSKVVTEISHEELICVITRLLIQLKIEVLHIINSRHAWDVVCKYGLAISQRVRIFASIFCDDYDKNGQPVGFAREYLGKCYKYIDKIFSDNSAFPKLLCQTYGYRNDFFTILKVPIEFNPNFTFRRNLIDRRVLWAGRLDRQKRPDLLLAIARAMPDIDFHVFGEVTLDSKNKIISDLFRLDNVKMNGGFDGVENLPFEDYSVFLYTSQWDGTPTIVIAAALASIPTVASCVGGVGDVVNEQTGFPIHDIENVSAYVKEIRYAFANPLEAEKRAIAAREYVMDEHSQLSFETTLLNAPGYFKSIEATSLDVLEPLGSAKMAHVVHN